MIDNIYHNSIMLIIITLIVAILITIATAIHVKSEGFIVDYRIPSFSNQQIIFDYYWPYYYTGMNASFLDLYALEMPFYSGIPVPYNYVITNQL